MTTALREKVRSLKAVTPVRGGGFLFFCRNILLAGILLLATLSAQAATYYVSPSGNDANNGTSWVLAKQTIQAAINVTAIGDTVLVADGTYAPITVNQGITVRSVNGAQTTIINGGGVTRCAYLHSGAVLDGFMVRNGYSEWFEGGGGVYAYGSTVQNCVISGNTATLGGGVYVERGTVENCTINENSAMCYGGGVYISGSYQDGNVKNCIISGNMAGIKGGGVANGAEGYVVNRGGTLENCVINRNTASLYGGGVWVYDGIVVNCTISGNVASHGGGGVHISGSYLQYGNVRNCIIIGNKGSPSGGGMVIGHGMVENCTISGNSGAGVAVDQSGTVRNCIVYYNQSDDNYAYGATISYSCIGTNISGVGNITNEPQFVSNGTGYGTNLVPGNYRLRPTSPCINAGLNQSWMAGAVDLDGLPRILDGVVDMGAYEGLGANNAIMRNPETLFNQCNYGSNAASQTIEVWNAGTNAMAYTLSADAGWISLSPASGTSMGEIDLVNVNYASAGLLPGTYNGIVTIASAEAVNSPKVVTVYLAVNKLSQTITFPAIPDQTVTSRVGLVATASSGLPVSFAVVSGPGIITGGTNLTFTAAGTVEVATSQSGDSIWEPAPSVVNAVIVTSPPSEDLVDLEVSDFRFLPVNLWAGDHPAMISFDLVNEGPQDFAPPDTQLEISFYLSSNTIFGDGDDLTIGTKSEEITLSAGSQTTIRYPGRAHNTDVTIPEGLSGDFYVFVSVRLVSQVGLTDPDGAVAMREGPIRVRIHPSDDGDNSQQRSVFNDYDADGQSDMVDYDEESGKWVIKLSASGAAARFIFGGPDYEAVPGDYDGDFKTDPAVHDGPAWQIMLSGLGYETVSFGFDVGAETRGAVGDYNGDELADPGLYEEKNGRWYVLLQDKRGNFEIVSALFGGSGLAPVVGDYDGDSRADPAVYEEATGGWLVMLSAGGYGVASAVMGGPGYRPVPGDYDGDGKTDLAIMDASGGWYYRLSGGGYALTGPDEFGKSGRPVPGDYDGDGKSDPAVKDSSGQWYFWLSGSSYTRAGPYSLTQ